jgi:hypothetical protein
MFSQFFVMNRCLEDIASQLHEPTAQSESFRSLVRATRELQEKRFFDVSHGFTYHTDKAERYLDMRDALSKKRFDPDIDPMAKDRIKKRQIRAHFLAALHTVAANKYARMGGKYTGKA